MVSILNAVRSFLNPGAPAIQTRGEMLGLDVRSAAGMTLYSTHQIGKPLWQTGNSQRYVSEGWGKSPVVFACTLAIADSVATAPMVVKQDVGEGQLERVVDGELATIISQPNPMMDQAEFFQIVVSMAALSGFCVIEKERNGAGRPVSLWPLRSDWTRPIPRNQSAPAWEYRVPGREPIVLEPEDVVVYTHAPDMNMGYTGTSPMAVAFRELGIENAMTDYLKAFFDHGAMPQHGIKTSQRFKTQEEADAFRERIVGKYAGLQNAADPMLLQGVEDVIRLGFDFDELAFPELRKLTETNICSAFRVPPILIGIQAGLDASTYSNYGQARRAFYEDVISSLWRRLDGAISRALIPEFDETGNISVEFDMTDVPAMQEDENELWARATSALQAGGISTHTFQRLIGIDPHGDDVIYQPFSATQEAVEEPVVRSTARIDRIDTKALPTGKRSARAMEYDSEEHRAKWEERVTVTELWERDFATALAAQMEEQRQDIIAGLSSRSVREIDPSQPFDKDKWVKAFRTTMTPIVKGIIREQGEMSATELDIGFGFNVNDPNVIKAMDKQVQRFATEVNDTTWDELKSSLADGIKGGEGIGQLAERVDNVMVGRIKSSKEAIARTEVTASSTIGTQESWEQSGVVSGKEWISALDKRTRDSHVEAHGQIVGIRDSFSVGGATGQGPGQMSSASESVNCRCSMGPVLDVQMPGGN